MYEGVTRPTVCDIQVNIRANDIGQMVSRTTGEMPVMIPETGDAEYVHERETQDTD
jgi:hypothetical protein